MHLVREDNLMIIHNITFDLLVLLLIDGDDSKNQGLKIGGLVGR